MSDFFIVDLIELPPELLAEALLLEAQQQGQTEPEAEEPPAPE